MSTPENDPLWAIRELIESQPWYKKFSNTVTAGVGSLIGLMWFGSTVGLNVPDGVQKWGFVVIGLLTTFGILKTPNGMTDTQLKQIEDAYIGRHRKL